MGVWETATDKTEKEETMLYDRSEKQEKQLEEKLRERKHVGVVELLFGAGLFLGGVALYVGAVVLAEYYRPEAQIQCGLMAGAGFIIWLRGVFALFDGLANITARKECW